MSVPASTVTGPVRLEYRQEGRVLFIVATVAGVVCVSTFLVGLVVLL